MASFGTDDFIVDSDKKALLHSHINKINRLFNVQATFDILSSKDSKQWIVVSGDWENRRNAKNYILALCCPEHACRIVTGSALIDQVLEQVEKDTGVFIECQGPYTAHVHGTLETCTMAVSQLEHKYRLTSTTMMNQQIELAKERKTLPEPAARILGGCTSHVANHLSVLAVDSEPMDIDATDTFFDRNVKDSNRTIMQGTKQEEVVADAESDDKDAIKNKEDMRSLGLGLGFANEDIVEAFQFYDFSQSNILPAEFMRTLDRVREGRKNTESEAGSSAPVTAALQQNVKTAENSPAKKGAKGKKPASKGSADRPNDSGASGGHVKGKANSSPRPSKVKEPSPNKFSSGHSPSPSKTGGHGYCTQNRNGECSLDESVVILGEDLPAQRRGSENLDSSVILVDAFPGERQGWDASPEKNWRTKKFKESFSDDDDQTCVMKPYVANDPTGAVGGTDDTATSAVHCDGSTATVDDSLRYVVVDGSNVAMSHGNDKVFSCKGIKLCVEYFVKRGHRVKVWVPMSKSYPNQPANKPAVKDQYLLEELKKQGYLGFTPSRKLNNKFVQSHDDLFILELAEKEDGVIVSNDNFREFNSQYGHIIGKRVLSYVFADDHFMLPKDPLGRYGPTLEDFLRKTRSIPQKKDAKEREGPKSAFIFGAAGNSRFGTMNAGPKSLPRPSVPHPSHGWAVQHRGQAAGPLAAAAQTVPYVRQAGPTSGNLSLPGRGLRDSSPPQRHHSVTQNLRKELQKVFPGQEHEMRINQVLDNHPAETDLNKLTNYIIEVFD